MGLSYRAMPALEIIGAVTAYCVLFGSMYYSLIERRRPENIRRREEKAAANDKERKRRLQLGILSSEIFLAVRDPNRTL
jgi:hypothetical protein